MHKRLAALIWMGMPIAALAQTTTTGSAGCAVLAQAAVDGATARYQANDTALTPPKSVTELSCLDGFFNGAGLDVITNFLNPGNLLKAVEGQICSAVNTAWQNALGSAQCGLSVSGFNMGFGGFGGSGLMCPKLSFGGGGPPLGGVSTGYKVGNGTGLYLNGSPTAPTGYDVSDFGGVY